MFKPKLGLGTKLGSGIKSSQSDLNSYLNSLKKKQRDVQKKYRDKSPTEAESEAKDLLSDDSDLASLAREFAKEEIQESPFLKKKPPPDTSGALSSRKGSVTTPLPENDAPFVNSLVKSKKPPTGGAASALKQSSSSALDNFMKFNKKYETKVEKQNAATAKVLESDTEPESEVRKIASDLEEKIRTPTSTSGPTKKAQRKKSQGSAEIRSPRSSNPPAMMSAKSDRLTKKAEEKNLKLHIPSRTRKVSNESSTVMTASEVSELPLQPVDEASPLSYMVEDLLKDQDEDDRVAPVAESPSSIRGPPVQLFAANLSPIRKVSEMTITEEDSIPDEEEEQPELPVVAKAQIRSPLNQEEEEDLKALTPEPPPAPPPELKEAPSVPKQEVIPIMTAAESETKVEKPKKKTDKKRSHKREKKEQESSHQTTESSRRRSRSHSRHRRHRHSHHSSSSSCVLCTDLCSFHLAQAKHQYCANYHGVGHSQQPVRNAFLGDHIISSSHYLFDPTKDLLYQPPAMTSSAGLLQGMRLPASSTVNGSCSGLMAQILDSQLTLTEQFLRTQKQLYKAYCDSLNQFVFESSRPKGGKLAPRRHNNGDQAASVEEKAVNEEDLEVEDYLSDFEEDISEAKDATESTIPEDLG